MLNYLVQVPGDFGWFGRWHAQVFYVKNTILVVTLPQDEAVFREQASVKVLDKAV